MKVFDSVPVKVPSKNVFNLSHDVKGTYNFDYLYPFLCHPVYPGDTFNCRAEVFLRAMPMLAPVMHNVDMHIYFFFVPFRLLWNADRKNDWKTYITGGEDGTADPTLPYFTYSALMDEEPDYIAARSLLDHMGFPTIDPYDENDDPVQLPNGNIPICSLPFRAYANIWNEYFRNQNVQNEIEFSYDQGAETSTTIPELFILRKKNYEKDYFTSCLPWAQRGQAMSLPISGTASYSGTMPVSVTGAVVGTDTLEGTIQTNSNLANGRYTLGATRPSGTSVIAGASVTLKGQAVATEQFVIKGLSIGTINDFRYNLRLQQWLENNARCGSRYIEQIFAHFGVRSSDARLQRPELLGGGKVPLIFTDVPQTSYGQGSSDNVVGDLAGKGTLYGKTGGFKKHFEEHGVLLGLCTIIPRTSYCQGIPRYWSAIHKTDWYFPEFAHLGEQGVLNKEVYYDPSKVPALDQGPNDVFGYQGRFTELRYVPSTVHGEMRTDLKYWHMGRIFDSKPSLNSDFVTAQTSARCFALSDIVNSGFDPFVAQIHLDMKAVRPLPKYAVPTL